MVRYGMGMGMDMGMVWYGIVWCGMIWYGVYVCVCVCISLSLVYFLFLFISPSCHDSFLFKYKGAALPHLSTQLGKKANAKATCGEAKAHSFMFHSVWHRTF